MKKVKLVISFLLFLLFTSSQVKANCFPAAKSIPMHRKGTHIYARSLAQCVTAEQEASTLMIKISRFVGQVQINIYDANGNVVLMSADVIDGEKIISHDVGDLPVGTYTIVVTIGNSVFVGTMSV